ncbi:hypothetical protein M413DRAFT_33046 [Hebeloma cylindrosporum]|uniref:Ubiquitin-like domain-containing protein n=1 Tax=Hebeloma cylindrosporum TaxID=76867 RepID=A0A0C3BTR2_HEBCY|nr:hypothetical protein M413DRAFT_33046 [Hebeloma cylindrosporum h7]
MATDTGCQVENNAGKIIEPTAQVQGRIPGLREVKNLMGSCCTSLDSSSSILDNRYSAPEFKFPRSSAHAPLAIQKISNKYGPYEAWATPVKFHTEARAGSSSHTGDDYFKGFSKTLRSNNSCSEYYCPREDDVTYSPSSQKSQPPPEVIQDVIGMKIGSENNSSPGFSLPETHPTHTSLEATKSDVNKKPQPPMANPKQEDANAKIKIRAAICAGPPYRTTSVKWLKIMPSTRLSILHNYADILTRNLSKYDTGSIRFIYDGVRIRDDDTPASLGMKNDDEIDVQVEQVGGFSVAFA